VPTSLEFVQAKNRGTSALSKRINGSLGTTISGWNYAVFKRNLSTYLR
jgi:hypothetical protein